MATHGHALDWIVCPNRLQGRGAAAAGCWARAGTRRSQRHRGPAREPASAERGVDALEPPDHERGSSLRLLGQLETWAQVDKSTQARFELDTREWGTDADVDAAAEADVLL